MTTPDAEATAGAARPDPRRPRRASPWPFVGMIAMAVVLFFYSASGLMAPLWAILALLALWAVGFVCCVRWWTPHPRRVVVVPLVLGLFWFAAMNAGGAFLGWTA